MDQNSGRPLGERVSFAGAPRPERALLQRQPLTGARVVLRPLEPARRAALARVAGHVSGWLAADNFGVTGAQRRRLGELTEGI